MKFYQTFLKSLSNPEFWKEFLDPEAWKDMLKFGMDYMKEAWPFYIPLFILLILGLMCRFKIL